MFNNNKIYVGCLGFAQVTDQNYYEKLKAEKEVLSAFCNQDEFKIPDTLEYVAFFTWTRNSHDIGTYYDLELAYSPDIENEEREVLIDVVNRVQRKMHNNIDKLKELCRQLYFKEINMNVVHKKIDDDEDEQGLKIA